MIYGMTSSIASNSILSTNALASNFTALPRPTGDTRRVEVVGFLFDVIFAPFDLFTIGNFRPGGDIKEGGLTIFRRGILF